MDRCIGIDLRAAAVLAAALALAACGAGGGGGSGPGPGPAAAPDAGRDRTAAPDLGGAPAAVPADGAADGGGSVPTDGAGPDQAAPVDGPVAPVADPTAAIPVAPIAWQPCADPQMGGDCARVKVPLDYAHPGGRQIELFVARVRASDPGQKIGSLFVNPGGPGAGGVSSGFLAGLASVLSARMRARFDVVSWDPRGVPLSDAVDCQAMPGVDDLESKYDLSPGTPDRDTLVAAYARWVQQCKAGAGDLLPFVGTSSTVSDLELLRRAVGDPKLNYLGLSYGTDIGLHYYLRYPERVRAVVVDGVEPIWPEDIGDGDQDRSFDAALTAFFEWCGRAAARDCPFARATASKAAAFDALEMALAARPVPAGNGRILNLVLLKWGVSNHLYQQGSWPALAASLEAARTGNGAGLVATALDYLSGGFGQDPSYAIDCGDHRPVSVKDVDDYAAQLGGLRIVLPYARLACVGWPVANLTVPPPTPAGPLPPIVLIGTAGDPATPYRWATAVKARLSNATLLTSEGYTHTAYTSGRPCIVDPVDAFFVAGTVPAAGIRCPVAEPTVALKSTLADRLPRLPPRRFR
jgi:pimeloyl-ACP methyl ester carboxylesterase